ncbi:hypothetical protein GRI97_17565 [Altererythrobacter xixiisoli]|uniref:Uncharacterized protein n=1 Tax=Croceibacterium xixiisoli TaxID=1476466 RepID=A0A6I4TZP1_9SPHN|nr:hypothetical protein [Croceibacterium xixiisoli]MXP00801.1 hypothetical protein [Croceibacterium xixiisoli]
MKPWIYVRLRREAAGLSIEEAARPFWKQEHHRADVERNLARLEQPGVRLRRGFHTADLARAFPFEIEVYRQLCEAPEESHPRLCLACGWDEWTIQPDTLGQDSTWSTSDPQLCTLCEQLGRAKAVG